MLSADSLSACKSLSSFCPQIQLTKQTPVHQRIVACVVVPSKETRAICYSRRHGICQPYRYRLRAVVHPGLHPNPLTDVRIHRAQPGADKRIPFDEFRFESPQSPHLVGDNGCVEFQMVSADAPASPCSAQHVSQHLLEHVAKRTSFIDRSLMCDPVLGACVRMHLEAIWFHDARFRLW